MAFFCAGSARLGKTLGSFNRRISLINLLDGQLKTLTDFDGEFARALTRCLIATVQRLRIAYHQRLWHPFFHPAIQAGPVHLIVEHIQNTHFTGAHRNAIADGNSNASCANIKSEHRNNARHARPE